MKIVYKYYVVDESAEELIGSFEANNEIVAKRCLIAGLTPLFKKKTVTPEDVVVYRYEKPVEVLESFNEVDSISSVVRVFDLSEDFKSLFKELLKDEK